MNFGAEFLSSREVLPEEHVGEPWGERELGIAFPAGPYLVRGLTSGQEARIARHFADVRAELGGGPEAVVEVTLAAMEGGKVLACVRGGSEARTADEVPPAIGLGLTLIRNLVEDQLKGTLRLLHNRGIEVWVEFCAAEED